jgi:hypothetical protein
MASGDVLYFGIGIYRFTHRLLDSQFVIRALGVAPSSLKQPGSYSGNPASARKARSLATLSSREIPAR